MAEQDIKALAVSTTRFAAGSPVPAWLLDEEPAAPGAVRGAVTFAAEADVIETPDYFVVVPIHDGAGLFNIGGHGNLVIATGKPIRVLIQQTIIFPSEMKNPILQSYWARGPVVAKRSFWQRVADLFR